MPGVAELKTAADASFECKKYLEAVLSWPNKIKLYLLETIGSQFLWRSLFERIVCVFIYSVSIPRQFYNRTKGFPRHDKIAYSEQAWMYGDFSSDMTTINAMRLGFKVEMN